MYFLCCFVVFCFYLSIGLYVLINLNKLYFKQKCLQSHKHVLLAEQRFHENKASLDFFLFLSKGYSISHKKNYVKINTRKKMNF